jgi:hypothetical protein
MKQLSQAKTMNVRALLAVVSMAVLFTGTSNAGVTSLVVTDPNFSAWETPSTGSTPTDNGDGSNDFSGNSLPNTVGGTGWAQLYSAGGANAVVWNPANSSLLAGGALGFAYQSIGGNASNYTNFSEVFGFTGASLASLGGNAVASDNATSPGSGEIAIGDNLATLNGTASISNGVPQLYGTGPGYLAANKYYSLTVMAAVPVGQHFEGLTFGFTDLNSGIPIGGFGLDAWDNTTGGFYQVTYVMSTNPADSFDVLNGDSVQAGDGIGAFIDFGSAQSGGLSTVVITDVSVSVSDTMPEPPVPTPEPSTLVLLASGLVGLLAYSWRKRK